MELAARGERVLGFAMNPVDADKHDLAFADIDADAILLGFVGFLDPPREEAIAAIEDCHTAGIRVVMITGDHATTAREIARQLGIAEDPKVLTGQEIDRLDEDELRAAARETAVFARTTPEHKLRLVQALQADGLTVAMTGDGVNDAPALKRADIGVAMGEKGTEVAKEAAEVVLADDNFASIVAAVREGRTVYDNVIKVIAWTLPTNGGEALTIIAALVAGFSLPLTPVQILWINTITAVALGLTFAFEPMEPGAMRRPPRPSHQPILTLDLLWRILFVSVLFVAACFGVFFWSRVNRRFAGGGAHNGRQYPGGDGDRLSVQCSLRPRHIVHLDRHPGHTGGAGRRRHGCRCPACLYLSARLGGPVRIATVVPFPRSDRGRHRHRLAHRRRSGKADQNDDPAPPLARNVSTR